MNSLIWALRRLAVMGPLELLHRARAAARDRFSPPAYAALAPKEAFALLFAADRDEAMRTSRLGRLGARALPAGAFAREIEAAGALGRGQWTLFGRPVRLDDPPAWSADPVTGRPWPDLPSGRIDYRRSDVAGGAKHAWEAGRLTMLPTLALAWRLTGERAHAERAARWLDDFCAHNPLGHGIQHTSGIEMALRVTTMSWTLALLEGSGLPADPAPALGLIAQQALHCRDHLSLGSSANNHLIAEYGAMASAGALFPGLRGADALCEAGLAGLARESLRQIHPDGVTAEQAFGYLPFVWELLLGAFLACEAAGRTVPDPVKRRLAASLEFARAVRLPGGRLPQVGDEDDARVLLAAEGWSRLDLVGNALAAWLGADALSDDSALAQLLLGRAALARPAADGRHEFESGGYTVWRESGLVVTFDHGPLGLGALAAHGHADALAITVQRGEDALLPDPGTFAYHEDPAARERCRGTPAHSTIHFEGRNQSRSLGPFLWGAKARVRRDGEGWSCAWASGETHWRKVAVEGGRISIHDSVSRSGAELVFALPPEARVELDGTRARVTAGRTVALFEASPISKWFCAPGEYAPRFGTRQPALRLCAGLESLACRTEITLQDA